jgi:hypothetical protein
VGRGGQKNDLHQGFGYLTIETIGFAAAVITCVGLGKRTQIGGK